MLSRYFHFSPSNTNGYQAFNVQKNWFHLTLAILFQFFVVVVVGQRFNTINNHGQCVSMCWPEHAVFFVDNCNRMKQIIYKRKFVSRTIVCFLFRSYFFCVLAENFDVEKDLLWSLLIVPFVDSKI